MKTITIHYPAGHSIVEKWQQTAMWCPLCGTVGLWADQGPGDYDAGDKHMCSACGGHFLTTGFDRTTELSYTVDRQRLEQLKADRPR